MKYFFIYGPMILQYGPTIFGFLSAIFWIFAALVKIPDSTNTELKTYMNQLRKQSRFIAFAALFAAVMISLEMICHWTGY